jgi:hypothetical protein
MEAEMDTHGSKPAANGEPKTAANKPEAKVEKKEGGGIPLAVPIIITAVGVAGLGVGFAFGGMAASADADAKSMVPGSQNQAFAAHENASIANIMFGVGGAIALTGAILFFFTGGGDEAPAPEAGAKTALVPVITPTSAGFAFSGGF